ncbi:MAG: hypothetical protein A3K09_00340 [Nitrospinae bacterium RIFCSPLOWO2_12_FULL_47_7]|nr:MAG: hypothetical protein A3K09_00340 [Nitrospinae bacterium RIFCSPLOWO2_12_FULL_47_7]
MLGANLKNEKNPEFCTKHPETNKDGVRPIQKVAAKDGKLAGAVIFIENIEKGKDWGKDPIQYELKDCDISPRVSVVRKAAKGVKEGAVVVVNQDTDILHNPHGYNVKGAQRVTLFNKPLPSKGDKTDVTGSLSLFKEGKDNQFFLQCDQHNFMEADGRIVWNPYYAVSGADGSFKIDQIPAGSYKVTVWQPYTKEPVTKEVTVAAGDVKVDFELAAK